VAGGGRGGSCDAHARELMVGGESDGGVRANRRQTGCGRRRVERIRVMEGPQCRTVMTGRTHAFV
jgi:hypothetical protein